MATAQAEAIATALDKAAAEMAAEAAAGQATPFALSDHGQPPTTMLVPLSTSGDRWSGDLTALGGKGAFVKEIDRALLDGEADIAVHNLKDIPGDIPIPDGLEIAAYPAREGVQDAVVAPDGVELEHGLDSLPIDAVVGTSSVRRQAQIRRRWPHLDVRPIRGNANTRLAKLDAGQFNALVLADIGLRRIGLAERISMTLPVAQMLPAVGAGQLAVVARSDRADILALCARLNERFSEATARTERAMLFDLGGHCNSPIAAYCRSSGERISLRAAVYALDGTSIVEHEESGPLNEPDAVGAAVAARLLNDGARELIEAAGEH